jgi:hypothetical protein
MIKEHQFIKRKRYVQKKERGQKWESIYQEAQHTCLGLGGLHHKKRREELLSANHIEKYRKRQYMEQACLYF